MSRGRKPTPTHLKLVKGNPGKRKIGKAEPAPESVVMKPPAHLNTVAKNEWKRVIPELVRWGLFSKLDKAALEAYCVAYSQWRKALDVMKKKRGPTYETEGRYGKMLRVRPEFTIASKALDQMRAFAAEFGMTPTARVRLKGTAQGELFPDQVLAAGGSKVVNRWDDLG